MRPLHRCTRRRCYNAGLLSFLTPEREKTHQRASTALPNNPREGCVCQLVAGTEAWLSVLQNVMSEETQI
jgi:hypothetical protein